MPVLRASLLSAGPQTRVVRASLLAVTVSAVNAGADQTVEPLALVTLTATGASSATWSQISGTAVTLTATGALTATFTAPATQTGASLVFRATSGAATDDMIVTVPAHDLWWWDGASWRGALLHA